MSDITYLQRCSLDAVAARAAAQRMAEQMASEFGVMSEWDGDLLRFSGSGVSGTLALREDAQGRVAELAMALGPLLRLMAPMIQEKVVRRMGRLFAPEA